MSKKNVGRLSHKSWVVVNRTTREFRDFMCGEELLMQIPPAEEALKIINDHRPGTAGVLACPRRTGPTCFHQLPQLVSSRRGQARTPAVPGRWSLIVFTPFSAGSITDAMMRNHDNCSPGYTQNLHSH